MANHTPNQFDTKRVRWLKMLNYYQSLPDALAANNPKNTDSLRTIMVKLLCSIQTIPFGSNM